MKKPGERSPGAGMTMSEGSSALSQPSRTVEAVSVNEALVRWLSMPGVPDEPLTLEEFLNRPAWHARAACRRMGTDTFFPVRGESSDPAKAVCEGCEVRTECLSEALELSDAVGIWGGASERGRREAPKGGGVTATFVTGAAW